MHSSAALYEHDRKLLDEVGALVLVGIDEAGRGPLAGPVVVAGAVLPLDDEELPVYDSKSLTEAEREALFERLTTSPRIRYAIAERSAERIDEINILRATHEGMREVAVALGASFALVDGLSVPKFPVSARFIVKGDATSASIAAASIIAKVHRDHLMVEYDAKYPEYGFARHKGYCTKEHLGALKRLGPCPIHRRSFGPVANIISPQMTFDFCYEV